MLGALKRKKKIFASTFKKSIIDIAPLSTVIELYSDGELSYLISSCIPKQKRIKFYCVNKLQDVAYFLDQDDHQGEHFRSYLRSK